jgi:hypothetical protein
MLNRLLKDTRILSTLIVVPGTTAATAGSVITAAPDMVQGQQQPQFVTESGG